ncbi:MAG: hypothetical protein WC341_16320, partial [Bacteroidales bacterium]
MPFEGLVFLEDEEEIVGTSDPLLPDGFSNRIYTELHANTLANKGYIDAEQAAVSVVSGEYVDSQRFIELVKEYQRAVAVSVPQPPIGSKIKVFSAPFPEITLNQANQAAWLNKEFFVSGIYKPPFNPNPVDPLLASIRSTYGDG